MPSKDLIKNLEYVKKSKERKKQEIRIEASQSQYNLRINEKEKATSVLTNVIRFRKAKQELALLKDEKAKKVIKRPVGRRRKPRNPVGRPKDSKINPK